MDPEVGPVGGHQCLSEVLESGLAPVHDVRFEQHHPVRPSTLLTVDRADAASLGAHPDHRLLVHLGLGDQIAGGRVPTDEFDAGRLADQAASPVAPDQVGAPERAVVHLDIYSVGVLRETHDFTPAQDRDPELIYPSGEDRLDAVLPQGKEVVVPGGKVADVEECPGVAHERMGLALGEKALGDAPLVEHLDGARVEAAGPRPLEILSGASLDDHDVDPGQRQLPGQHQPGWACSGDHHSVLIHRHSPPISRSHTRYLHSHTPGVTGGPRRPASVLDTGGHDPAADRDDQ